MNDFLDMAEELARWCFPDLHPADGRRQRITHALAKAHREGQRVGREEVGIAMVNRADVANRASFAAVMEAVNRTALAQPIDCPFRDGPWRAPIAPKEETKEN